MIAAEVPAGPLCHIPARESPSVHQTGSRHSADLLNHPQVLVFPTENTNPAEVEMREDRPPGSRQWTARQDNPDLQHGVRRSRRIGGGNRRNVDVADVKEGASVEWDAYLS